MVRILLYAVALFAAGFASHAARAENFRIGDKVPDFLGQDYAGRPVRLSDDPGKVTVITFWATWCGPCLQELPVLEAIQESVGKDRFRVIGINFQESLSTFENTNKSLSKFQMTFSYDAGGAIAKQFGINGIPHLYIVDGQGEIVDIHVGYGPEMADELAREITGLVGDHGPAPNRPDRAPRPSGPTATAYRPALAIQARAN